MKIAFRIIPKSEEIFVVFVDEKKENSEEYNCYFFFDDVMEYRTREQIEQVSIPYRDARIENYLRSLCVIIEKDRENMELVEEL